MVGAASLSSRPTPPACRAAGRCSTPRRTASHRVPPPAWPEVAVCASAACWRGHRPSAAPSRAGVPAFSRVGCLLTPTFPGLVLTPVWISPVGGPGQGERELESTSYYPRLRGNRPNLHKQIGGVRSIPAPAGELSWDRARRVVARVEWHRAELFPRAGFIVTNMTAGPEGVVRFYNCRVCQDGERSRESACLQCASTPLAGGPEDDKDGQEAWFTAGIASLIG